jgi:hypothetical protein
MNALTRRNPAQTDTAASNTAFRRWFGASEVVDADGAPLVVYHGTTAGGFDAFRPNYRKGEQLGFGIHFAQDRGFAAKYAEDPTVARKGKTPKVYAVYLSIQRPLVADAIVYEGTPEFALAKKLAGSKLMTDRGEDGVRLAYMQNAIDQTSAQRAEKLIREAGYDGILYEAQLASHTGMGWAKTGSSRSFVVFSPTQVKSATDNEGTFDHAEPSILRNPAQNPQAATPAFKRWFGASKVVNAKGEPRVMYHGTHADFDVFDTSGTRRAKSFGAMFTPSRTYAANYGRKEHGGKVLAVYLRIENPFDAKNKKHDREWEANRLPREGWVEYAHRAGYDGAITMLNEYVVFDPAQVKSATDNAGTFDPADASILRNPASRNPAEPRYTLLGVDEEVTTCEHCGKADLKCTVVLGVLDADGNVEREARFGRSCAAKALRKPSTTTANKMESLARVAEFKRVWAMRVDGPGVREQVAAGRIPVYVTSYPLEDGRTLLVSSQPISPPRGTWTRLGEGRLVGHPAKTNPRRGGRR